MTAPTHTPTAALAVAVAIVIGAGACSDRGGGRPARRALQFPVEVQPVEARAVEYAVRAVGTIDVFERVQVTARVAGAVDKVLFQEGTKVKANQVLVQIDPARYALAERQARAAVDRARIAVKEAEASLARRQTADSTNPGLIPGEELETWSTRVATAKAELAERTVARDRAALDQRDAHVRAPIAGEIQTRTVETGAYVQPGTVLATMIRREPLLVRFDVAEIEAAALTRDAAARLTVDGDDHTYSTVIEHIAAAADPVSRMVRVTARIDDDQRDRLRPGGFAQVVVPIGAAASAAVVPESAVRPSERGFLAYVVEDDVAHERVLELGLRTADGLVEVKRGLQPGERLVVRGAEALRDGAPVKVSGPPAAPGPARTGSADPAPRGRP